MWLLPLSFFTHQISLSCNFYLYCFCINNMKSYFVINETWIILSFFSFYKYCFNITFSILNANDSLNMKWNGRWTCTNISFSFGNCFWYSFYNIFKLLYDRRSDSAKPACVRHVSVSTKIPKTKQNISKRKSRLAILIHLQPFNFNQN